MVGFDSRKGDNTYADRPVISKPFGYSSINNNLDRVINELNLEVIWTDE